jgi:hypothetical protein
VRKLSKFIDFVWLKTVNFGCAGIVQVICAFFCVNDSSFCCTYYSLGTEITAGHHEIKGQVPEEELESGRAVRRARAGWLDEGFGEKPARFLPARFFRACERGGKFAASVSSLR